MNQPPVANVASLAPRRRARRNKQHADNPLLVAMCRLLDELEELQERVEKLESLTRRLTRITSTLGRDVLLSSVSSSPPEIIQPDLPPQSPPRE